MSVVLMILVGSIYGASALIAGGVGIACLTSRNFRKSMIGDQSEHQF